LYAALRAIAAERRTPHARTTHLGAVALWREALADAAQIVPECLAILVCLGLMWTGLLLALAQLKANALQTAMTETATLAQAYAESTERISLQLDHALLTVRRDFADKGERFDLRAWVRDRLPADRMTLQVAIAGADAIVAQSTLPLATSRISVADREHFRVPRDQAQDVLFVSKPVRGRVSGLWTLQFTRKLLTEAGAFAGIVAISVGCEDLSRFYEIMGHGSFIGLVGTDGVVRALGPEGQDALGLDLSGVPGFAAALGEDAGSFTAAAPWDGARRVISFRRLRDYPLAVLAGYDETRAYRDYRSIRDRYVAIGATATLIILGLGGVWLHQRLRSAASRQALLLTLGSMGQGIAMVDTTGRIRAINRRFVELLELPQSLLSAGAHRPSAESRLLHKAGLPVRAPSLGEMRRELRRTDRIVEAVSKALPNGGLIHTLTDVTEQRMAEDQIRHLAEHDPLTDLANRLLLHERMTGALRDPTVTRLAVACLDLDNFKVPNDTLGHDAGDRLLQDVAHRLLDLVSSTDMVARSGGDAFAVLRIDADGDQLAFDIVACLDDPFEINGTELRLSASIGIATYPEDGATAAELLQHADMALYQAKGQGRAMTLRFDPAMDVELQGRSALESDLGLALQSGQIQVWFQPRFEISPLRIAGFEALARWPHPTRGLVSPTRFIPIAEQCGLITELSRQVLEQACALAACLPDGRIALNLSPVQFFADDLPEIVAAIARRHGIPAERLELEVTEGVLIKDEAQALRTLQALHDNGLHLALDDFGTGYASLSYLRRFPFDRIKLDKSFVQAQEQDSTTKAIIESMLAMARRLDIAVTAEGVETSRQLALLRSQNCPEVQGFLFGRPMSAEAALRFYRHHQASAQLAIAE
jgi:diguanylate cyclase (GGDEF)-like protein